MDPYIEIILRSAAIYFFMVVALRVFGKKELSQLNTADVILILLISNSVQNAMVGSNSTLWGGIAAASALFVINFGFKKLMFNSKLLKDLLQDKPQILVHNGKADFKILAKLEITHEELTEALHEHGLENLKDVKLALLEMDGNISIISGNKQLHQTHYKRRRTRKTITRT